MISTADELTGETTKHRNHRPGHLAAGGGPPRRPARRPRRAGARSAALATTYFPGLRGLRRPPHAFSDTPSAGGFPAAPGRPGGGRTQCSRTRFQHEPYTRRVPADRRRTGRRCHDRPADARPDWTARIRRICLASAATGSGRPSRAVCCPTERATCGYESACPCVGLTHFGDGVASPAHGRVFDDGAHGVDLHGRGD